MAGRLPSDRRGDPGRLRELTANSVLHSASRDGGEFTLRAEVRPDRLRIEVEDAGGPWRDDSRPHGLDVVAAIPRSPARGNGASTGTPPGASPGPLWAGEMRMAVLPPPGDASRVSCFLADHPRWSAWWDKKHGLWRVAEDDPDSDLYAESSDADTVMGYITAHARESA